MSRNIRSAPSFVSQNYVDDPIYEDKLLSMVDARDAKEVKAVGLLDMGNFEFGSKSYEIRKGVNTYFPFILAKLLEEEGSCKNH